MAPLPELQHHKQLLLTTLTCLDHQEHGQLSNDQSSGHSHLATEAQHLSHHGSVNCNRTSTHTHNRTVHCYDKSHCTQQASTTKCLFLVDDQIGTHHSCWTVPGETTLHGGTTPWSRGTTALSSLNSSLMLVKPVGEQFSMESKQQAIGTSK